MRQETCIAEDEMRRAELAWAFVRWALVIDRALAEPVTRRFQEALAAATGSTPSARCFELELAPFGFLGEDARIALRMRAVAQVLEPAAKALIPSR